jgi:hypothetical protein
MLDKQLAAVARTATSGMKPLSNAIIVDLGNADASRRGIIVLDLADQEAALKVAHIIADTTGRSVTVRDADMIAIQTIPAATSH